MTLLPLLCLIAGVLLVLVLLGGSPGRFIGRCGGWAGVGGRGHTQVTPLLGCCIPRLPHCWVAAYPGYPIAGLLEASPWVAGGIPLGCWRHRAGEGLRSRRLYTLLLSRAYPLQGGGVITPYGGGVTPTTEVNEKAKPFDFAFLPTLMRGKLPSPYGL